MIIILKKKELKFIKKLKKEALKQYFIFTRQVNLNSFINSKNILSEDN